MKRILHKFICKTCHIEFIPKQYDGRKNRHNFCSRKCRYGYRLPIIQEVKLCKFCNLELMNRRRRQQIHDGCLLLHKRKYSLDYNSEQKVLKERKCKQCDVLFIPVYRNKRRNYCSLMCAKRAARKANDRGKPRKLARKYNVPYEYINPIKVFERDGWECRICRKKTPKSKRGTHASNAPELDHRIPISKGGGHLYSNVQCLCRSCNVKKSNKNSNGQKPLFEIESKRSLAVA